MQIEAIETEAAAEARARFTIEARALSNAVKLLSGKVTETRSTIPILSCLLIEAAPCGRVTLTATDLDIWATVTLAADPTEEIEPGALCLDADALAKLLAKVAKNSDWVRIEAQDSNRAKLKAGRNEYKLPGLPRDDFPMPKAADVDCAGVIDRAQFLGDLKALAPAVSTEETRYYLNGYAMQVRDLGGVDRFAMVATDGRVIGAASRPIPAGLESWADAILPRKLGAVMLAADKVAGEGEGVTLSRLGMMIEAEFGAVRIVSKLIDGTYPQWPLAFERIATPTGEQDAPMFPELLPGAPVADMEKLAKLAPGAVTWENGNGGLLGTVASDPGFLLACHRGPLSDTGRNGFTHRVGGHDEAAAYLKAIAEGLGLPSDAEMQARVDAINAAWGEPDCESWNENRPHGAAAIAGDYVDYRHPMQRGGLIQRSGKVLGYTVAAFNVSKRWTETRPNWETLVNDVIEHPETIEPVEGSYSVVMPDHGPQLAVMPDHYVDAADGHRYPIADNGSKIHLSADQVRALIGDSVWTVLEFPGADGKPRYVSQWLWDDGAGRLLCVGKDGRCPKADAPREYVTRAEVEAALAGEIVAPVMIEAPAPIAAEPEAASAPETALPCDAAAPCATPAAETVGIAPIAAPAEAGGAKRTEAERRAIIRAWQMRAAMRRMRADADTAPEPVPAEIMADIAEAERLIRCADYVAPIAVQCDATPISGQAKRTPAHERMIRRAWAERGARRMAQGGYNGERIGRNEAVQEAVKLRHWHAEVSKSAAAICKERDALAFKRRRAVVQARNAKHTARHFLRESLANYDRRINAEHEARDALAMREDMKRMLAAAEARLAAAEAENAQLWAEIEGLTAPVTALAA